MGRLAALFYAILRTRVPSARDARISYTDLLTLLPNEFAYLDLENPQHRNEVSEALGEVVAACRAANLPALSALVVRRDREALTSPGPGYYPFAHPNAGDRLMQEIAWGQELAAAQRAEYPEELPAGQI
jgi:hypothetical protein